jgi:hypothetical protein
MPTTQINFGTGTGGVGWTQVSLVSTQNFGESSNNVVDYLLTNQNSPATPQAFPLSSGNNTINQTNCPALANAGGVWLIPGPANGSLITLKGATGDTGIVLSLAAPTFIPFNVTPPVSFVLSAAGSVATFLLVWV